MDTTQKKQSNHLVNVICALEEVQADSTLPRNVRAKLTEILASLKNKPQNPLTMNRVLDELDELSFDTNMEPFTRTQIFNIISMLEFV